VIAIVGNNKKSDGMGWREILARHAKKEGSLEIPNSKV
jgi:hypothetical protein